MKKLIAISGGIGSGKSVVSKILTHMHYCVYDCDSRAKILMDTSSTIKQQLKELISPEVINFNNDINRPLLSQIVFNNSTALATLNNIVHSAVKEDLLNWFQNVDSNIAFVETAILYQSKFDSIVDAVWEIEAPIELRIKRVMSRNNLTRDEVQARIDAQTFTPKELHQNTITIYNDNIRPLLPQICFYLNHIS